VSLNRRARIGSPENSTAKNNNPDTASVQTTTPAQSALPLPQVATTKTGKPRLRMKWTNNMNKDLMRCYYKVTEGDTITIGYRQELHQEFTTIYPQFTHLTKQHLMDQKRFIINNNKIPLPMLQQMKQEVLDRLTPIHRNTHNDTRDEANLTPQNTHNSTLQHP
jgi:hypothetical protein